MTNPEADQHDDVPCDEQQTSRYVTVFHQLKDTDTGEAGDRWVGLGEQLDDVYIVDEEQEGFIPAGRPIAVIDAGVGLAKDDLEQWCNSHAGQAVLNQYFDVTDPDDPTLPDAEEYLRDDRAEGDSTGERGQKGDVQQFIEQHRGMFDGALTDHARGYRACLDRLEEFVSASGERHVSIAQVDLKLEDGQYVPAEESDDVDVHEGEIYIHTGP